MRPEFERFAPIPRLSRECVITEKIDGTNAQVCVTEEGEVFAGSRNRWLDLENDNYGFAKWVEENKEELSHLGPGRHYGEWWGSGIQRGYGLLNGDKRFSLFNTGRWHLRDGQATYPSCCSVVPVLYVGRFDSGNIQEQLDQLYFSGSVAAPGFKPAEGVVVYHVGAHTTFKKTIEKDDSGKEDKAA